MDLALALFVGWACALLIAMAGRLTTTVNSEYAMVKVGEIGEEPQEFLVPRIDG
jgi:hypothetical protein